jgi:hypothetical protein
LAFPVVSCVLRAHWLQYRNGDALIMAQAIGTSTMPLFFLPPRSKACSSYCNDIPDCKRKNYCFFPIQLWLIYRLTDISALWMLWNTFVLIYLPFRPCDWVRTRTLCVTLVLAKAWIKLRVTNSDKEFTEALSVHRISVISSSLYERFSQVFQILPDIKISCSNNLTQCYPVMHITTWGIWVQSWIKEGEKFLWV